MRTIELFRQLDRRQYVFHFCSLSGRPGELDDEVRRLGGEVHLLSRNQASFQRRFRKLLREQRFDVVNSQVFYYSGMILRMAAQCDVPIRIAQFQNTHDGRRRSLVRRIVCHVMRGLIARHATNILAVSEGAMNCAWRKDWRSDPRCRVIYNGVGISSFPTSADRPGVRGEFGLSDDTPLCIHIGRFLEQKNHLRLPDIFSEVLKSSPDARLLLVGEGGNKIEQNVQLRIARLGIEDRVIFAGRRGDVPRLLMAADVMLFPSLWEGLPGVVQEACLAGTPVVASDLPGVREISAELDGVRYLPLSAPNAQWAAAVSAILNSRWSHTSKEEARKRFAASPFAIDRVAEQYCRIWRDRESGIGGRESGLVNLQHWFDSLAADGTSAKRAPEESDVPSDAKRTTMQYEPRIPNPESRTPIP